MTMNTNETVKSSIEAGQASGDAAGNQAVAIRLGVKVSRQRPQTQPMLPCALMIW